MNVFESIVKQEKQTSYAQRNKELFGFYTLTLIAQEQAAKKVKTMLWVCLILLVACGSLFFSPINQLMGDLIAHLSTIDMLDILKMALISYGITGILFCL
jgi:hypothetical protein